MAERDHLRPLQMGVAGQERGRVLAGAPTQHHAGAVDAGHQFAGRGQRIQPHVGGHLIVAAARRVQAAPRIADKLDQPAFDIHVNVFQGRVQGAAAFAKLMCHMIKTGHDRVGVLRGYKAHGCQHAGVGLTAAHIVAQKPPVEPHACVERCRGSIHRA